MSEPNWSSALTEAVVRLGGLQAGWDGPGSQPVANRALFKAESLIREILAEQPHAIAPYLVPGGDGSVQIEWHEKAGEIELSIDPGGELYIWGREHLSQHEFEGEGEKALALFARWAPWLAAGAHDGVHASRQEEEIYTIAA